MKTKEQVKKHLTEVGYSKDSINKIMGFLIGIGLKESEELYKFKIGEHNFDYFYAWFQSEEQEQASEILEKDLLIIEDIFNSILDRMEQNDEDFDELRRIMQKYGLTDEFDNSMKN